MAPTCGSFIGAGVLAGVVSAGVGGRVVMRVVAILDPSTDGAFTDSSATVGEFTIDGTIPLLVLGAVLGAVSGIVYLGLRRWLPCPTRWRGVTYGAFTLVTGGQIVFDPANADFQIFEPVIVAILLFTGLFFINGILLASLLDRWHPDPIYPNSRRVSRAVGGALAISIIAGSLLFLGVTIDHIEDEGTCLTAVGAGNGCAVAAQ